VAGRHATKFLERILSVLSHYQLHSLSAEIQQTLMCCGDTPGGNPMPHAASHQDEPSVFLIFVDLAGTGASLDIFAFITAATISLCTTITATITTATTTTTKLTTSQ
jgi:hypothetical protein